MRHVLANPDAFDYQFRVKRKRTGEWSHWMRRNTAEHRDLAVALFVEFGCQVETRDLFAFASTSHAQLHLFDMIESSHG